MKKFKVNFQAMELVWNNCYAIVQAENKIEAYNKMKNIIERGENPFEIFEEADWDGENEVTLDVVDTEKYYIEDFEDCPPEEIKNNRKQKNEDENKIEKAIKDAFGDNASLIHFDKESNIVLSKKIKGNEKEYILHNLNGSVLFDGFYADSFEKIALKYLEKKGYEFKKNID